MFKILKFIEIQKFLDSDQNAIANKMLIDVREQYYMHPEYLFLMARYLKTTKKFYQAIDCLHASLQHNNDLNFLNKKNYKKSTNELVEEKILLILELSKIIQNKILVAESEIALKNEHPDKTIMLIAEKGTMGVGSSRMSGVNNVALWIGKQASPYVPFVNIDPIVAGTNGISPIFMTTVSVTGGIGIDLKNWVKKKDNNGKTILNSKNEPVLEQMFSIETGTILKINTKDKKIYKDLSEKS